MVLERRIRSRTLTNNCQLLFYCRIIFFLILHPCLSLKYYIHRLAQSRLDCSSVASTCDTLKAERSHGAGSSGRRAPLPRTNPRQPARDFTPDTRANEIKCHRARSNCKTVLKDFVVMKLGWVTLASLSIAADFLNSL